MTTYRVGLASSSQAMLAVRSLRNRAFMRGKKDAADDIYDIQRNSRSYLLYSEGPEPAGTVRISIFSGVFDWLPIPVFDLYGDEFSAGPRRVIVQSSLFAIDAEQRGIGLAPKLLLIREVLRRALEFRAEIVVTVVRNQNSQLRFYRRMGFVPMGPVKIHPLADREAVLIGVSPEVFLGSVRACRPLSLIGELEERGPSTWCDAERAKGSRGEKESTSLNNGESSRQDCSMLTEQSWSSKARATPARDAVDLVGDT